MKRQMTLTIETRQVQILRVRPRPRTGWCAACAAPSEWLTPERAALQLGLNPRWLYRQLENARLPFVETTEGIPFVCVACVARLNLES